MLPFASTPWPIMRQLQCAHLGARASMAHSKLSKVMVLPPSARVPQAGQECARLIGKRLQQERQAAELGLRQCRAGVAELSVKVLRQRLADAAHEVPDQAGASELRQGAGEGIADDDLDPRALAAGLVGYGAEPVVDTARCPRAAARVTAAARDHLAKVSGKLAQRALARKARSDWPEAGFEP